MRDLASIQRRFYELVASGEGAIAPGLLGASRRLAVYADMYIARLVDVLADDYPKLRAALGADAFHELAAAYVRARPPSSFTLRDAGERLAAYLEGRDDLPAWAADLARIERARVEVFDGADAIAMTRDDLASVPIEQFPDVKLTFVPACVVVAIDWTVDDLWSAIEADALREAPELRKRTILIWRRVLQVVHRTLDDDEAMVAASLVAGTTISGLSDRLAELLAEHPAQRMVALLSRWLEAGVLAA